MIGLLTKEYHLKQLDRRPNVIQTLLAGALACTPTLALPPHVVRYLGKTFNAWHTAIGLIQETVEDPLEDENIRESALDALAETFADLSEDDLLYGLWRRRCFFPDTACAISYEQAGMWTQAQLMYENAQIKGRQGGGGVPFSEAEYHLWEDHWVACAQKMQQVRAWVRLHGPD
jgi:transformation/transcription domain-associated protein